MSEDKRYSEVQAALTAPFPGNAVQWKPQVVSNDRGMAVAFVDPRLYQDRLNAVCPDEWHTVLRPWGPNQVVCELTICGVTRSSAGEAEASDKNTATSAEAQAFKRACTMFGLGRYLYNLPKVWKPVEKKGSVTLFTAQSLQELAAIAGGVATAPGVPPPETHDDQAPPAPPPPVNPTRPPHLALSDEQKQKLKVMKQRYLVTNNDQLDYYIKQWMPDAAQELVKLGEAATAGLWKVISRQNVDSFLAFMDAFNQNSNAGDF